MTRRQDRFGYGVSIPPTTARVVDQAGRAHDLQVVQATGIKTLQESPTH